MQTESHRYWSHQLIKGFEKASRMFHVQICFIERSQETFFLFRHWSGTGKRSYPKIGWQNLTTMSCKEFQHVAECFRNKTSLKLVNVSIFHICICCPTPVLFFVESTADFVSVSCACCGFVMRLLEPDLSPIWSYLFKTPCDTKLERNRHNWQSNFSNCLLGQLDWIDLFVLKE